MRPELWVVLPKTSEGRARIASTRIPKYRRHAASGQARATVRGKTYYLGKFGTPESRAAYKALLNEHLTGTGRFAPAEEGRAAPSASGTTINEVVLAYLKHAEAYYKTNPAEIAKVKMSTRLLRKLHGRLPAARFDSLALEAVQEAMAAERLARSTVNERVRVIKRMVKWAARKKMVPASVYGELALVEGLKRGGPRRGRRNP